MTLLAHKTLVIFFFTFKSNLFIKNYVERIKENIKNVKKLPKLKGIKNIYYPGEKKVMRFKYNSKKEINIPTKILDEIYLLDKS